VCFGFGCVAGGDGDAPASGFGGGNSLLEVVVYDTGRLAVKYDSLRHIERDSW